LVDWGFSLLYFFHTSDGARARDTTGTELADHNAARIEATKFAGLVLQAQPNVVWDNQDFRVEVTDDKDMLLFTVITLAIDAPAAERR
jgi:hypothetical protein